MRTLKIGFSRPKTWKPFASLIMNAYRIPYDHVYIKIYAPNYDREIIYQASKSMVNFMSPDVFKDENLVVREFEMPINEDSYRILMQFAIDNAGKHYGVKNILGLTYVRICYWLGKTVRNPFNDRGATYICSELVAKILKDFEGLKLDKDLTDMTPLDVYNLLISLNSQVVPA